MKVTSVQFTAVTQSCPTLRPHELQHARPPCPSPTPGVYPNSCPLSWWCHPAISSSVVPFSFCPQSFPASGSFQMSQLFASGGQSILVMSSSLLPHELYSLWNFLGHYSGVHSHSLLQGIFPTQELNWGLVHGKRILYQLSYQVSPKPKRSAIIILIAAIRMNERRIHSAKTFEMLHQETFSFVNKSPNLPLHPHVPDVALVS